jgi:hypothetical protein
VKRNSSQAAAAPGSGRLLIRQLTDRRFEPYLRSHLFRVEKLGWIWLTPRLDGDIFLKSYIHKDLRRFRKNRATLSFHPSRPDLTPKTALPPPFRRKLSPHSPSRGRLVNTHFQTWGHVFRISNSPLLIALCMDATYFSASCGSLQNTDSFPLSSKMDTITSVPEWSRTSRR